ncbi:MAG: tRNA uridine-5-carboxymethylaminomethyl(34) synthesis enzyme MnmG [Omnitrophica WOR_2 bacterium RBG_13_44_8b]|nr:MAG: tRNA uridine-5-carboxymethylaminomethyl(34) synthesis enzyme MnmG [Omnitrophica WOR_2 bacterium RBG_13_44_8b]
MHNYECIVIGAGHAGIEASLACSRMGCRTLLITFSADTIGKMSCNPAIGGVGKGQLVKEIDALGGEMGKAADACGIQFRILNASKGAAVHSSRAQIDMDLYQRYMKELLSRTENLFIKQAEVKKLLVKDNKVLGVITHTNEEILSATVIICPGTFLDGLIHVGLKHTSGGRINEPASLGLAANLKQLGFNLLRFKTGTCPRLDKRTIDNSHLIIQNGDKPAKPFSFSTRKITGRQIPCHITYTNKRTHKIILDNLDRSPLYAGIIKAAGVRYCPSVEDKIVKFKDRDRHQVFLEPQGIKSDEIYPNGLSTSLPEDVQMEMLQSIEGLENVKVIRFGYGIEHTVVEPTQAYPTLETKLLKNLYLAGQINGTTGYEEAAAQGLIAGINAGLRVKNKPPLVLDRSGSYIGVLIDDLTTKGTLEPYRMFTSRVEYRLILREDNADLRLRKIGFNLGLVKKADYRKVESKIEAINKGINFLKATRLKPTQAINNRLTGLGTPEIKKATSLEELLKRPQVSLEALKKLDHIKFAIPESALAQVEIEVKYAGFIQRQLKEVERFKNLENIKLPRDLDFTTVPSLSREIKEKLNKIKPFNLGQASRISGVTPAAISILMVYLKKLNG